MQTAAVHHRAKFQRNSLNGCWDIFIFIQYFSCSKWLQSAILDFNWQTGYSPRPPTLSQHYINLRAWSRPGRVVYSKFRWNPFDSFRATGCQNLPSHTDVAYTTACTTTQAVTVHHKFLRETVLTSFSKSTRYTIQHLQTIVNNKSKTTFWKIYEGRLINKLQNSVVLLVFLI